MKNKNLWIIMVVILVLVICCCVIAGTGLVTYVILQPNKIGSSVNVPELQPTLNAQEDLEKDSTPGGGPISPGEGFQDPSHQENKGLSQNVLDQMDLIETQVEAIRGLENADNLKRSTLSPDELRSRVMDDFFADYTAEEVEQDNLVLSLFGLLEPGYDLHKLFVDLYSEQIAGFYDDETQEMVIVQGEQFLGPERMTYAHEYTHALQDRVYDLENGLKMNDETCDQNSEYCAAVQALLEGDATLTETLWFLQNSTTQDKKDILEYYQGYQSPVYDSAPDFLKQDFLFSYVQGLEFAQQIYETGGFDALDRVYQNLPQSTEQILHPQKYPEDQPELVQIPDLKAALGSDWQEIERDSLGEWYTYLIMAEPVNEQAALSEQEADAAAEGWGGDQYVVLQQNDKAGAIMVAFSQWDTAPDADEFWQQLSTYGSKRWGSIQIMTENRVVWSTAQGTVLMSLQGNQVLWIIAPSVDILQQISQTFPDFPQE
jgi:hypothetical protein